MKRSKGHPSTPLIEPYVPNMLGKDSIKPVPLEPIIRSRLFSVLKEDSTEYQMMLDLSVLIRYIPCQSLKTTTTKSVRQAIDMKAWIVTWT